MKSITICTVCQQDAPFETGEFWTQPQDPSAWQWTHQHCRPSNGDTYVIPGPQIDTAEKAVAWRSRLLELPWLKLGALDRGLQSLHRCLEGGCC